MNKKYVIQFWYLVLQNNRRTGEQSQINTADASFFQWAGLALSCKVELTAPNDIL